MINHFSVTRETNLLLNIPYKCGDNYWKIHKSVQYINISSVKDKTFSVKGINFKTGCKNPSKNFFSPHSLG